MRSRGTASRYRKSRAGTASDLDAEDRIVQGLLATLPTNSRGRRWDLAPPYLLRHLIQHATDACRVDELLTEPGFLVHANATTLTAALHLAVGPGARLAAAVYRASADSYPHLTTRQRRDVLAIDAARYGAPGLRDRLAAIPPSARWQPRWATGSQVNSALRIAFAINRSRVGAVACTVLDGRPVAVSGGGDGTVRVWDLACSTPIGEPLTVHDGGVEAVACAVLEGRPVAVTGGDRTVRVWDLASGVSIGEPLIGHRGSVWAVACTVLDGRPVAVIGGRDGMVRVWDLDSGASIGEPFTGHDGGVGAVACTVLEGRSVAVTGGGDGTVRVWDLPGRREIDRCDLPAAVSAVALGANGVIVVGLNQVSWAWACRWWGAGQDRPHGEVALLGELLFRAALLRTTRAPFDARSSPVNYAAMVTGWAWMSSWQAAQTTRVLRRLDAMRAAQAG